MCGGWRACDRLNGCLGLGILDGRVRREAFGRMHHLTDSPPPVNKSSAAGGPVVLSLPVAGAEQVREKKVDSKATVGVRSRLEPTGGIAHRQ